MKEGKIFADFITIEHFSIAACFVSSVQKSGKNQIPILDDHAAVDQMSQLEADC